MRVLSVRRSDDGWRCQVFTLPVPLLSSGGRLTILSHSALPRRWQYFYLFKVLAPLHRLSRSSIDLFILPPALTAGDTFTFGSHSSHPLDRARCYKISRKVPPNDGRSRRLFSYSSRLLGGNVINLVSFRNKDSAFKFTSSVPLPRPDKTVIKHIIFRRRPSGRQHHNPSYSSSPLRQLGGSGVRPIKIL